MNVLSSNRKLITAAGRTGRFARRAGLGYHAGVPDQGRPRRRVSLVAVVVAALATAGACPLAASASSSVALNWTKQHPATLPPARVDAPMAYDAATGNVVLFSGYTSAVFRIADTWVWNGSTWTRRSPATSPSWRWDAPMAYDAATGNVVLFGGDTNLETALGDTWAWNGSAWTEHAP